MEEIDYDSIRENLKKESTYTEKKPQKPQKSRRGKFVIAGALIAVVFLLALMRPAIIGYSVYGNVKKSGLSTDDYSLNVGNLNSQLLETQNSLSSCSAEKTSLQGELGTLQSQLSDSKDELDDLNSENEKRSEEIQELNEKNSELEAELNSQNDNYEELLRNSARSICCKEKVDNENIDFYTVEDGKVSCSEESGEELKCW